jgi:hypothetical protein
MIKYSKLRDKLKVETLNGNAEDLAFLHTIFITILTEYQNL